MILSNLRRIRRWLLGTLSLAWQEEKYDLISHGKGNIADYHSRRRQRACRLALAAISITAIILFFTLPILATPNEALCPHPVLRLTRNAQKSFESTLNRQSKSFNAAVAEYKRRYNMPPPPHFDLWYKFATDRGTVLIDEFDIINRALLPFWGVSPSVIRERTRQDLGYKDNMLMGWSIRAGKPIYTVFGERYQRDGMKTIIDQFAQWLPDMDLAFNVHDEPRVVVPHEELSRMISVGREAQDRLARMTSPRGIFSKRKYVSEWVTPISTTRYNDLTLQENWGHSTMSCPADTPARDIDGTAQDDTASYEIEPLGFLYNLTAFSDVCKNPSLRNRLGLFKRPHILKLSNEITPVFSASAPSSFQDIPMPSMWYYKDKMSYEEDVDPEWKDKRAQLYWRGGNSGAHSDEDSWRSLLRQQVVGNLTHPIAPQYTFKRDSNSATSSCRDFGSNAGDLEQIHPESFREQLNIKFTEIDYCEDDCKSQLEFFGEPGTFEWPKEAWRHRYLLDMDGWAYSGRFYAFLRSKSLPMKLSVFREWHQEILVPWVHFVPLNKDVREVPELIRYFEYDPHGQVIAQNIAANGRSWAKKALRKEDMEVYMFRLLLEFARVQDDAREMLAYKE
ncbi:uncharacterized protein N7511_011432 [Penicillium nucicola]|uniref:uncharacterized protein n=1 Tax=Penicillium nucicola TaxID=1850975 RepID=UPI0025456927|nr:uncharacterized protein N7511_011432 [Penicillium nucicola]KAJ5742413.1 hypothetical protein N7511_011432 [Penicillium nucicola]